MRVSKKQSGFTLVEMLVTTLILAFGLLGMAGLQTLSLRNNNNAYLRTQANILAYDIVDSMRANRTAALAGQYDISLTESPPSGSSIANSDLSAWLGRLGTVLPQGDGAVACDTTRNICTVTVQWRENTNYASESDRTSFLVSAEM